MEIKMKFVLCMKCTTFVQMKLDMRTCDCGNVTGKYMEDGFNIAIHADDMKLVRIVGVANDWMMRAIDNYDNEFYPFHMNRHILKELLEKILMINQDSGATQSLVLENELAQMMYSMMTKKGDLFRQRMRPIIMVKPFTTGDIHRLDKEKEIEKAIEQRIDEVHENEDEADNIMDLVEDFESFMTNYGENEYYPVITKILGIAVQKLENNGVDVIELIQIFKNYQKKG